MHHDLLLAEELLLLSLDDEKGSDQTWSSVESGLAGAVLATVINLAIGIEFPASIATAIAIVFITVVALVLVDRRRGRPSRL